MSTPDGDLAQLTEARLDLEEIQDRCERMEAMDANGPVGDVFDDDTTVNSDLGEDFFDSSDFDDADRIIPNFSENDTVPELCQKVDQALFSLNAFVNTCPTVSNFKYNPKHCDPGFWCGCSDPSLENCAPSNDTTKTFWAGQYTENVTDSVTNELKPIVYTGWAARYPDDYFRCNTTLYCPGMLGDVTDCPKLCRTGHYCPTSAETIVCPVGHYCRTGAVEPTKCRTLERCDKTGLDNPAADWFALLVLSFTIFSLGCLTLAYLFLNRRFPFCAKQEDEENQEEQAKKEQDEERIGRPMPLMRTISVRAPKFQIHAKFSNLQLTLPNGICIMQGVSGELKPGSFTAIMGPSGAGKSTFLSLLSGKSEPTGGTLEVNGENASLKDFRSSVGFVPQEDIMLRELTVEENIRHSAFMRLPNRMSREDKLERIYQTMESLDLLHIRNSVIGDELVRGISGGQRKRVNVAMELVADPSLLALDEPTSGLDSTTSSSLCETLSELAMKGVTVAAVIHQPKIEILQKFSNVLLLGVGGRTVYMGRTENMESYFDSIGFPLPPQTNPADFYIDVISGLIPRTNDESFKNEDLFDLWENRLEKKPENSIRLSVSRSAKQVTNRRKAAGVVKQTFLLFKRAVLQRLRAPQNTIVPVVLSATSGILIGYFVQAIQTLYYGIPFVLDVSNPTKNAATQFLSNYPTPLTLSFGDIWIFTASTIMLISVVCLNTFGQEQAVFKREHLSGTKPTAYWLAKSIELSFWLPLYAAVFVTVAVMFQPQPISVVQYFFVIWISMLGYGGVAHIVSLFFGPSNRGIVYLVCCLTLIMVFSGIMIFYNGENKIFLAFFSFWVAQGYYKGCLTPYEDVFDVDLLNEDTGGFDLHYPFEFDMLCAFLTAILLHLVALPVLMYRSR